jgi:hypothetical protein
METMKRSDFHHAAHIQSSLLRSFGLGRKSPKLLPPTLFDQHHRQGTGPLAVVVRMKLVWKRGEGEMGLYNNIEGVEDSLSPQTSPAVEATKQSVHSFQPSAEPTGFR